MRRLFADESRIGSLGEAGDVLHVSRSTAVADSEAGVSGPKERVWKLENLSTRLPVNEVFVSCRGIAGMPAALEGPCCAADISIPFAVRLRFLYDGLNTEEAKKFSYSSVLTSAAAIWLR
jgi:hypothetical protein